MADQETNVTNRAETTLSGALAIGGTTINVTAGSAFPAVPFYAVIDPGDDAKAEVVVVDDSKSASAFTLTGAGSRGQDGTSDVAHDSGATIAAVPVAALWTDINDRVDAAESLVATHDHDGTGDVQIATSDLTGHTKAAHDALNIDADTLDGLDSTDFEVSVDHLLAVKTADESMTSDTTLQNDDHLVVTLEASTTYVFELVLFVSEGGGSVKAAFVVPSGSSLIWDSDSAVTGFVTASGSSERITTTTGDSTARLGGRVTTGGTPGDLQLQWAQNGSTPATSTLKAGSWIEARKVA